MQKNDSLFLIHSAIMCKIEFVYLFFESFLFKK